MRIMYLFNKYSFLYNTHIIARVIISVVAKIDSAFLEQRQEFIEILSDSYCVIHIIMSAWRSFVNTWVRVQNQIFKYLSGNFALAHFKVSSDDDNQLAVSVIV